MHIHTWMGISALIWILVWTGCDNQPGGVAPAGAPPAVKAPIGPIPGPGEQPALARNPYAHNAVALTEGRKLFVWYNCAGCHGGHGGGGMGPSLRDRTWLYGNSDVHIFDSVAEGRAHGMPAWATGEREPQPPQ